MRAGWADGGLNGFSILLATLLAGCADDLEARCASVALGDDANETRGSLYERAEWMACPFDDMSGRCWYGDVSTESCQAGEVSEMCVCAVAGIDTINSAKWSCEPCP